MQRLARASSLALLMFSVVAQAEPLAVGLLPTRSERAAAWRARVAQLAAAAGATAGATRFALGPLTHRADGLSAAGRLDEAAALYDLAVEEGTRAPLDVEDPPALIHALLARASIGLARGEQAQAEALLARALRWDPTLALSPDEDTPRMSAVLARVRARAGTPPPLTRAELGARCDRLVVARPIEAADAADASVLELSRIDQCRPAARTLLGHDTRDDTALAALGVALAPVAVVAAPPPSTPAAPSLRKPIYKRAWLWVTLSLVAAAAVGGGVGAWAATRPSGGNGTWNVTPHF